MPVDQETREAVREAFRTGQLLVETIDPKTQVASLRPVSDVLRHRTPHKAMVCTTLVDGRSVATTEDHSLFQVVEGQLCPVAASQLQAGQTLVTVNAGVVALVEIMRTETLPPQEFTYDLSVPGPENFVLSDGILAHNSYSIGGISLDLEKSSKYESMKQNAEGQFDKSTEAKARTVRYIRGLQQPKYGLGVRSSFGVGVGRGVLSPRSFIVWAFGLLPLFFLLAPSGTGLA